MADKFDRTSSRFWVVDMRTMAAHGRGNSFSCQSDVCVFARHTMTPSHPHCGEAVVESKISLAAETADAIL
jgi:hypothetical protein